MEVIQEHLDLELKYNELEPPLCWKGIFGSIAPVEVEIGFGKCGFLIDIATQNSSTNFLGIELSRKYYRKGIKKIQRTELDNVKLLWGEAFHIFKQYMPDSSIANIYVNFPDPWPKKRHAKRRLLNADFASLAVQKLVPSGCIEIATDVESYMEETLEAFQANETYDLLYYKTSKQPELQRQYVSDYEQGFLDEGKIMHYAKYQKK